MDYQLILDAVHAELRATTPQGTLPDYIPELATVDPDKLGLALRTVDGKTAASGHAQDRFSLQSVAKVLGLSLALTVDPDALWGRVGVEPSGDPFNSLVQLEYEGGIPRNPLINAGALVVCDLLVSRLDEPERALLDFVRELTGCETVGFDERVAASELATGFRNRALVHLMKAFGNIDNEVERVMSFYVHLCALSMSCEELARAFLFLAADGQSGARQVLTRQQARRVNAIMLTCGFYDEAGQFAFYVGLPGKSGVGGGILAIAPGQASIAVWSPGLDDSGNSHLGRIALEKLTQRMGWSVFEG